MGGGKGNIDPARKTFVTGVYIPSAEGGMANSHRSSLRFSYIRILALFHGFWDNTGKETKT